MPSLQQASDPIKRAVGYHYKQSCHYRSTVCIYLTGWACGVQGPGLGKTNDVFPLSFYLRALRKLAYRERDLPGHEIRRELHW